MRVGKWSEAAELLAALVVSQPNSYPLAYMNALALQNSHHAVEAEAEARRALMLDPNSADALTLLGLTLSSQARYDEAISTLARAAELDPEVFRRGILFGPRALRPQRHGRRGGRASESRDFAARRSRGAVSSRHDSGSERGHRRRDDQYKELQQISPNDARGYLGLGEILGKTGEADDALVQLRKARELDPSNFEIDMALGRELAKAGKLDESIEFLRAAAKKSPEARRFITNLL